MDFAAIVTSGVSASFAEAYLRFSCTLLSTKYFNLTIRKGLDESKYFSDISNWDLPISETANESLEYYMLSSNGIFRESSG